MLPFSLVTRLSQLFILALKFSPIILGDWLNLRTSGIISPALFKNILTDASKNWMRISSLDFTLSLGTLFSIPFRFRMLLTSAVNFLEVVFRYLVDYHPIQRLRIVPQWWNNPSIFLTNKLGNVSWGDERSLSPFSTSLKSPASEQSSSSDPKLSWTPFSYLHNLLWPV